jgi:endonuclease/exonuclease/phosphatase (EEP) superfamily protein YafD
MELFEPLKPHQVWIQRLIGFVFAAGALLCYVQPNSHFIKSWVKFAPQLAIIYWLAGILFLVLKQPRLTMISFVCCGFLCLFLKNTTSDEDVSLKKNNVPSLRIAQINIAASNSDVYPTLQTIRALEADVISLQEVNLDWHKTLKDSLRKTHPYSCRVEGADLLATEFYTRLPIIRCDTFYSHDLPNLHINLKTTALSAPIHIVSSYIQPPSFSSAYDKMQAQLSGIAQRVRQVNAPTITVGDYNIEASSFEIQNFRQEAGLLISRRGFRPYRPDGKFDISEVPTDHIFFTPHLQCIGFEVVIGAHSERIGITGTYQLIDEF